MSQPSLRTAGSLLLLAALAACAAPAPSDPPPSKSVVFPGTPPTDRMVRFDKVSIDDQRLLTLRFVGGKAFSLDNPCSRDYVGWAAPVGEELHAAVVDVTPPRPVREGDVLVCTAEGYSRAVGVELAEPFTGTTVRDLTGYLHFVAPPQGLAELRGLPEGWQLVSEGDVEESPTGRWRRTYGLIDPEPGSHQLELYQSFDGPASVSGGEEQRPVTVGNRPALLYRQAPPGELVLVWQLGTDGLALVAYEQDFSVDELIALAESAVVPED